MQLRKENCIEETKETLEKKYKNKKYNSKLTPTEVDFDELQDLIHKQFKMGNSSSDIATSKQLFSQDFVRDYTKWFFNGKGCNNDDPTEFANNHVNANSFVNFDWSTFVKESLDLGENDFIDLMQTYTQAMINYPQSFLMASIKGNDFIPSVNDSIVNFIKAENRLEMIILVNGPFEYTDPNRMIKYSIPGKIEYQLVFDDKSKQFIFEKILFTNSVLRDLFVQKIDKNNIQMVLSGLVLQASSEEKLRNIRPKSYSEIEKQKKTESLHDLMKMVEEYKKNLIQKDLSSKPFFLSMFYGTNNNDLANLTQDRIIHTLELLMQKIIMEINKDEGEEKIIIFDEEDKKILQLPELNKKLKEINWVKEVLEEILEDDQSKKLGKK